MKRILLTALNISFITISMTALAGMDEAMEAYREGDYATAFKEMQLLASKGDRVAQSNLGVMYSQGQGTEKNEVLAVKWHAKSANQNFAVSQVILGDAYQEGAGVKKNAVEAAKWYRKAAELGDPFGQQRIAVLLASGIGVKINYDESIQWLIKSWKQGNEESRKILSMVMAKEEVMAKNDDEKNAIEKKHADILQSLGYTLK